MLRVGGSRKKIVKLAWNEIIWETGNWIPAEARAVPILLDDAYVLYAATVLRKQTLILNMLRCYMHAG